MDICVKVAPSILAADVAKLGEEVKKVENSADYLHIDIMDGHFVPNLSFSSATVAALRPLSRLVFDVHLMVAQPGQFIEDFANAGADIITVHAEGIKDIRKYADKIHALGKKAGISIKPETPVSAISDYIELFDLVLLMTVEPGFGGQAYMNSVNDKITEVRSIVDSLKRDIDVEIDGGVTTENAYIPINAGANVIVSGSAIFNSPDPALEIRRLRENGKQMVGHHEK